MKKLLSFLLAFVFGGLISFALFNNNMFLVLMLCQNKETAQTQLIEQLGTFQYRTYYNLTITESFFDTVEDELMEKTSQILLVRGENSNDFSFIADMTIREKDGDVSDETISYTFYYTDNIIYINNKTDEEKTKDIVDFSEAIAYTTYNSELIFIEPFRFEEEFDENFVSKIIPTFSTSPFYLGVSIDFSNGIDEDTDFVYSFSFDFLGNYRGMYLNVSYDEGLAGEMIKLVVNNGTEKPFELDFPSDLLTDTEYVAL